MPSQLHSGGVHLAHPCSARPLEALEVPRVLEPHILAAVPDGERVVVADGEGKATVWKLDAPGDPEATFDGHAGMAYDAMFSPDGRRIASELNVNTIR